MAWVSPTSGTQSASYAVALPERLHLLVGHELAAARLLEPFAHGRTFFLGHHVGARATRLDFTRDLHELILILLGPGFDFFEKLSCGRGHDLHIGVSA